MGDNTTPEVELHLPDVEDLTDEEAAEIAGGDNDIMDTVHKLI